MSPILEYAIQERISELRDAPNSGNAVIESTPNYQVVNNHVRGRRKKKQEKRLYKDLEQWINSSPAVKFVKEHLEMGWSYKQIIEELDKLYESAPEEYSSSRGQKITTATLSLWAKKLGLRRGNKTKIKEWEQSNEGFQWFRRQIIAGVAQDEIIAEFNLQHKLRPEAYSTFMGSGMTISTYLRWKREILSK